MVGDIVRHKNPSIDLRQLHILEIKNGFAVCHEGSYEKFGEMPKTYRIEELEIISTKPPRQTLLTL